MNTPNNKRRQETRRRIERTFVELLQTKSLEEISVTLLCRLAEVNRTTFYSNYIDIYDLADAIRKSLEEEVFALYPKDRSDESPMDFMQLYRHIYDNQIFYKTYFKMGFDVKSEIPEFYKEHTAEYPFDNATEYRLEFFRAGLNAVLKKWLAGNCQETPEEIFEIVRFASLHGDPK